MNQMHFMGPDDDETENDEETSNEEENSEESES